MPEERGSRVDAENPGIGERIAGQCLNQRARDAERHSYYEPHQCARYAHFVDDDVGIAADVAEQRVPYRPQRNVVRTDRDAGQQDDREQTGSEDQTGRSRGRATEHTTR